MMDFCLESKSFYGEIEPENKDNNKCCRCIWWFTVKVFYKFLSPLWYKNTNHSFEQTDPTDKCDNDGPIIWPDIKE